MASQKKEKKEVQLDVKDPAEWEAYATFEGLLGMLLALAAPGC